MRLRRAALALLFALLVVRATAVDGQPTPSPYRLILERETGTPVTITHVSGYEWTKVRDGGVKTHTHLYCISFAAAARPVSSVTFEISHRRLDGSVTEVATLKRDGAFAPGVEIRSYQGEHVNGPADQHAIADCLDFSPPFIDAPVTVVRPIAVTYADGGTWTALRPPVAVATAAPATNDQPPPWDADHHAGYIGVLAGGGETLHGPKVVLVYAPHHRTPSATIALPQCCAEALAFGPQGELIVASSNQGILFFTPGASAPSRRLQTHNGIALAVSDLGDVAIGGPADRDVAVTPGDGGVPYRITGSPMPEGLAFSPSGELALLTVDGSVRTYRRGAAQPNRTLPAVPKMVPGPTQWSWRVAYDRAGNLAVENGADNTTRIYAPGAQASSASIPAADGVFDAAGDLVAVTVQMTRVFSQHGGPPQRTILRGGIDIAADRATPRYAVTNPYRREIVVFEEDGSQTIVPNVDLGMAVAISP